MPVATTVHQLSIVDDFPRDDIDLPLSLVVTPDETIEIAAPYPSPNGINWDLLDEKDLEDMPVLRNLKMLVVK